MDKLKADNAAKDLALSAKLGTMVDGNADAIPDVAWGLLWAEYFHRTKQYQFVAMEARRSRGDRYGNKWSLEPLPNLDGLEGETYNILYGLSETFGYDPHNPPVKEFLFLKCEPNRGAFDMACVQIEKYQAEYREASRMVYVLKQAIEDAQVRGNLPAAEKATREMEIQEEAKRDANRMYQECRSVIENAIQRFYLIPMEAFEKMDICGLPIKCVTATVAPQKKHLNLPEYTVQEETFVKDV